jgi:hypothetical protein
MSSDIFEEKKVRGVKYLGRNQKKKNKKQIPWLLVRKRTIATERPPLVGEVSANFCE